MVCFNFADRKTGKWKMENRVEAEINELRGGQFLSLELEENGEIETLQCKLEMKIYETSGIPYKLSGIIVAPVDDTGKRIEEGMYYEKECKVETIKSVAVLQFGEV